MKRREFIKNSALAISASAFLAGCRNKETSNNYAKGKVIRRNFCNTTIPLLGLGGLAFFPMKDNKEINMPEFEKMLTYAMEHGANYFDTANIIINEKWQQAIKTLLKNYPRENYILGNKMPAYLPKTKSEIKKIFNKQLKDCGVEYFDNYSISCLIRKTIGHYREIDLYNQLANFKKEGKIKNLGFSECGPKLVQEIVNEHKWDYCQLKLNYLGWKEDKLDESYAIIDKTGIPIIATEVLRGNTLSKLPDDVINEMKNECPQDSQTSFALRWAASKKRVASILCDMTKFKQLQENISTFTHYREFNKKEEKIANDLAEYINSKNTINCMACKNCIRNCPKNIKIPDMFAAYNRYKISNLQNKEEIFLEEFEKIDINQRAEKCIECNACSQHCPQRLEIPKLLKEVRNIYLEIENKTKV